MFGARELVVVIIVLLIVLLIFGPKRIKNLGAELGNAIKGFRNAVREKNAGDDNPEAVTHEAAQSSAEAERKHV